MSPSTSTASLIWGRTKPRSRGWTTIRLPPSRLPPTLVRRPRSPRRVVDHGQGHAAFPEQAGQAGGRALAVGGHDQLVALAHQVGHLAGEAVGVAHHRVPAPGLDGGDVRAPRPPR